MGGVRRSRLKDDPANIVSALTATCINLLRCSEVGLHHGTVGCMDVGLRLSHSRENRRDELRVDGSRFDQRHLNTETFRHRSETLHKAFDRELGDATGVVERLSYQTAHTRDRDDAARLGGPTWRRAWRGKPPVWCATRRRS